MIDPSIIPAVFFGLFSAADPQPLNVSITTQTETLSLEVELADSPFEQLRGLMFRQSLKEDGGMLFHYSSAQPVQFWMKNVSFGLDILFIDACGAISQIHENAKANDETIIASLGPVLAVLEIEGGASKRAQIKLGDQVSYEIDGVPSPTCSLGSLSDH
jgi:hypothetical protein